MRNAELDESQAGIKIVGRNINNLRYADDTILMAESEGELNSLLMNLWGRKCSPRPTPPPSWLLPPKPTFSLYTFTFIKRLLSSSSLSAIRVVSSAYLRLLIFLLAILIPACASSSPVFLMMYSAYKLNKQGDNIRS